MSKLGISQEDRIKQLEEDLGYTRNRAAKLWRAIKKARGYKNWPHYKGDMLDFVISEVERLGKIANKLPKTKDKVTVAPGEFVWFWTNGLILHKYKVIHDARFAERREVLGDTDYLSRIDTKDCYSTKKIAECKHSKNRKKL